MIMSHDSMVRCNEPETVRVRVRFGTHLVTELRERAEGGLGVGLWLGLGLWSRLGLGLGLGDSCPINQSQNVMAQAIIYLPFHGGAHHSLRLHVLQVAVGSKPLKRSDPTYDMRRLDHSRGVI